MVENVFRYGDAEPDLDKCATRAVGATIPGTKYHMYYCTIYNADCRYARAFGFDYVCKHIDNHLFAKPADDELEYSVKEAGTGYLPAPAHQICAINLQN